MVRILTTGYLIDSSTTLALLKTLKPHYLVHLGNPQSRQTSIVISPLFDDLHTTSQSRSLRRTPDLQQVAFPFASNCYDTNQIYHNGKSQPTPLHRLQNKSTTLGVTH
jgi:hypothetical protein